MAGMKSYFKTLSTIPKNNYSCNFCEIPSFAGLATVDLRGPMRQALQGPGYEPRLFSTSLRGRLSLRNNFFEDWQNLALLYSHERHFNAELYETNCREFIKNKKAVREPSRTKKKSEPRFFLPETGSGFVDPLLTRKVRFPNVPKKI